MVSPLQPSPLSVVRRSSSAVQSLPSSVIRAVRSWGSIALLLLPGCARAQQLATIQDAVRESTTALADSSGTVPSGSVRAVPEAPRRFRSRADSITSFNVRRQAAMATGYRIVVSLEDRRLAVLFDEDTLRVAPVAVASGLTLEFAGKTWRFDTPRGLRRVIGKDSVPLWTPPEWAYAEVAADHDLQLAHLSARHPTTLADGRHLVVRDSLVGVIGEDSIFYPLPVDEHVVFDGKLFVPPIGTKNRRIPGILGRYRLDLGQGYLLHGTPDAQSIGRATTHGCVRLGDDDIEWLYWNIPVGTRVFIY